VLLLLRREELTLPANVLVPEPQLLTEHSYLLITVLQLDPLPLPQVVQLQAFNLQHLHPLD